jgi:hypothetical protein
MIPTKKSEREHLGIEGTSHIKNTTKIAQKRHENHLSHKKEIDATMKLPYTRRSDSLQNGVENLSLKSKEMRSSPDGWFALKP